MRHIPQALALLCLAWQPLVHAAGADPRMACLRADVAAVPKAIAAGCDTPGASAVMAFSERVGAQRYEAALADAAPMLRNATRAEALAQAEGARRDLSDPVSCRQLQYIEGDVAAPVRGMTVQLVHASGKVLREQYRVGRVGDDPWRVMAYELQPSEVPVAERVTCTPRALATARP